MSRKNQAPADYQSQFLGDSGNNNNNKQHNNPANAMLNIGQKMLKPDEVAFNKNFLKYGTVIDILAIVILMPYVFGWFKFGDKENWEWWQAVEPYLVIVAFMGLIFRAVVQGILGKVEFK